MKIIEVNFQMDTKYPYSFTYSPDGMLLLDLPNEIRLFSHFIELIALEDEVNEIIESIDSVQRGDKESEEIMIDAPTVLIKPNITSVSLADILDEPPPDQYIETDEFRKLILIWQEKLPVRFINKDDVL